MTFYTKKPVTIEAFKVTENYKTEEMLPWFFDASANNIVEIVDGEFAVKINSHAGNINGGYARIGDYIIKGIKGEIYACDADIFEATYDVADVEVAETPTTEGIKGYTPVSLDAKHEVNINKDLEEIILQRIEYLQNKDADPRNLAIAKTYIEEAFMRLNRGIFKPARIELSEAVINNNKKFIPSAKAEIA